MFDWLGDILSGLGDALSVVFEGVGADIAVDIWNALVEWIYNTVFDAVADLFTSMNNMGAEIFSLSWVNAVVRLFTLFGWALFTVGVVGAVFEVAIESQSGRVSIKGAALNVLKGFFACALIGVLPVELYKFCVSLQNSFAGDLTRIFSSAQGTTIGEIAVFILRAVFRLGTPSEPVLKLANETHKQLAGAGFEVQRMKKADIKRFLAIYFGASMDGDRMPDVDGAQYVRGGKKA